MNLPGYIIRRRLGSGGQAVVYLATQESLDRPVALKVLHPQYADSDEFTARFINEGRIVANLDHDNVVTIHDIGVAGDLHFLSMELVEGGDLRRRIRAGMEAETILDYLITIADCLALVHDKHIVHRDIKPENVLFRRNGTLLLTDFGIAKRLQRPSDLTMSGTTLGSPNYLSPEQAKGSPLDGRADLYSLGAMAYEMFTGARAYASASEFDTVFMHLNAPLPRLPDHYAKYQPIIDGTMAKSPDDRFSNADQFADLLRSLRGSPVGIEPTLLPATSLTSVEHRSRRNPHIGLPQYPKTAVLPAVTVGEVTRTEGTRLPLGIVAIMTLFLVAAWLTVPLHERVTTEVSGSPPAFTASTATLPDSAATTSVPDPEAEPMVPEPIADAETAIPEPLSDIAPEIPELLAKADPAIPEPHANTGAEIPELLAKAESALGELRLTRPRDDNALGYFRQVLAIDDHNAQARAGQRRIASRYVDLATQAFERQELSKASTLVSRGLRAESSNIDLRTLQAKLRRARSTPLASSSSIPLTADSVVSVGPGPYTPARETFN